MVRNNHNYPFSVNDNAFQISYVSLYSCLPPQYFGKRKENAEGGK